MTMLKGSREMKFYHYSKEKFKDIRSKLAQGVVEDDGNERQYGKNVSLFLEPLPRNVADIFNGEHEFYTHGLELWEYVVDSSDIPADILFTLTESPEKTDLLFNKQKWYEDMPKSEIDANKKEIDDMEVKKKYTGKGRIKMIQAVKSVPKGIEGYFKVTASLNEANPREGLNQKYAACVPHLMIYPGIKPIPYRSCSKITLD